VDPDGNFAFKPVWGMKSLAAASSNGFAIVSLGSFATNPIITLEPYGKITGTLRRPSGPGTNENLGLMFAGMNAPRINFWRQTITDEAGHFDFDHVPAGHLQICVRKSIPGTPQASMNEPLQEVDLKPGQSLEVNITAASQRATEVENFYNPPQPKPIPGIAVKGIVLLPGGQPADDADVALQVEGKYLGLGKGVFTGNPREEGFLASTGPDGSFTLPMYEGAKSVIALNEEGYAQVSLEQLKTSPRIKLQKWGRIAGTLRVGHHAGTNELVVLDALPPGWDAKTFRNSSRVVLQPPFYDSNAFQARTDDQGRFVITFVPPGEQRIARLVSTGVNSWTHSQLATVDVMPGETTVTNVGGTGRTVIGRVRFADRAAPDFRHGFVVINTPIFKIMQKVRQLKTDAERTAFYQSEEFQAAVKDARTFSAALLPDGSFHAEDVLPGRYEVDFQQCQVTEYATTITTFTTPRELTVPAASDKEDDSPVDWGDVELEKYSMAIPPAPAGGK
jgi:hypothetical protein